MVRGAKPKNEQKQMHAQVMLSQQWHELNAQSSTTYSLVYALKNDWRGMHCSKI